MINRTESYRDYIASLVTLRKAFLAFDKAFQDRPQLSHDQFVAALTRALDECAEANRQVQAVTREYV